MKTIEYKGYIAKIEFDEEDQILTGVVIGMDDLICFHADSAHEIIPVFHQIIDDYLKACEEEGIKPQKSFSGRFMLRLPPQLHAKVAALANSTEKSINAWITEQLEKATQSQ
jgi:predicted HicB family RNase H-like nuclease